MKDYKKLVKRLNTLKRRDIALLRELLKESENDGVPFYFSRPLYIDANYTCNFDSLHNEQWGRYEFSVYNDGVILDLTDDYRIRKILDFSGVDDIGEVSDGYHTFNSLYRQRCVLFAALVKAYKDKAWKSRRHSDGELCFGGGWFIVGIETPEGQYTYHYEDKDWNLFECTEVETAPEWDGHTDEDVERLLTL